MHCTFGMGVGRHQCLMAQKNAGRISNEAKGGFQLPVPLGRLRQRGLQFSMTRLEACAGFSRPFYKRISFRGVRANERREPHDVSYETWGV